MDAAISFMLRIWNAVFQHSLERPLSEDAVRSYKCQFGESPGPGLNLCCTKTCLKIFFKNQPISIFKNKNNNRHSSNISSDFWNRKWQGKKKENENEESMSQRDLSPLLHIHSLPLLLPLMAVSWRLRRSFLVYDRADISSREGKKWSTIGALT